MSSDLHQILMDRAYDRYKDLTKQEFMDQLDPAEHFAVVLGNLNYQVQNGGWMQWLDNGYGSPDVIDAALRYYRQIGTPSALKARELLEAVKTAVEAHGVEFDRHGHLKSMEDEDEYQEFYDKLEPLCSQYYSIDDQLMVDVEAFISKTFKVEPAPVAKTA